MSINIIGGGVAGITVETDPLALKLTGGTVTGKVNFTPVAGVAGLNIGIGGTQTASTVNGDMWIATGGNWMNFRDANGIVRTAANVNSSNSFNVPQVIQTPVGTINAALRVTQLGTGNAIEIEDNTTPDSTRFVVDQHGKVGCGIAPDSTACLRVDANGIKFGTYNERQNEPYNFETRQKYADSLWLAHNFKNYANSVSLVEAGGGTYNTRVFYTNNDTIIALIDLFGSPTGGFAIKTSVTTFACIGGGAVEGELYVDFNGDTTGEYFEFWCNGISLTGSGQVYIP
jgi:hypothetical protein